MIKGIITSVAIVSACAAVGVEHFELAGSPSIKYTPVQVAGSPSIKYNPVQVAGSPSIKYSNTQVA